MATRLTPDFTAVKGSFVAKRVDSPLVFSDQIFLFLFLPITLAVTLPFRATRAFPFLILAFSLVFFYWSSGNNTLLLFASIALNFFGGLAIDRWHRRATVFVVVLLNVSILVYYKYTYFALSTVSFLGSDTIAEMAKSIALPIGISFFTFQGISYVVDVWRRQVKAERNIIVFAAYKAFFPQLIAGPIVRYADVHDDFYHPQTSADLFTAGTARFMVGLCKKVLVADTIAVVADAAFSVQNTDVTFVSAWIGAIAYSIQIYYDFSGYSDMAIGLAMMFGIRFQENFNHPYASSTITEFWRRWHISLSSWFRDYMYIPLGGNRRGKFRTYVNLFVVFLATGIWHGAAWTFVLWGMYHGFFLIVERLVLGGHKIRSVPLRLLYFFPVVSAGWVLFRSANLEQFVVFIRAMFTPLAYSNWVIPSTLLATFSPIVVFTLLTSSVLVLLQGEMRPFGIVISATQSLRGRLLRMAFVAFAAASCSLFVLPQSFSPFLYFRF